jgi:hypothetical protein
MYDNHANCGLAWDSDGSYFIRHKMIHPGTKLDHFACILNEPQIE